MNRVNEILEEIGRAGRGADGSYTRLSYSREYFHAVKIVEEKMRGLGMETAGDAAGNIWGRQRGKAAGKKSIILGSHLDTVQCGGLYDGAYGVAAALEAVRRLREEKLELDHPLEIYGFNGEEAGPLGGTFGSRAVAGLVKPGQVGLGAALEKHGHGVEEILGCRRDFSDAKCYLELHVEQGDRLYSEKKAIGVVCGIVCIREYTVIAHGRRNHAGTTSMENRRDALISMAKLLVYAEQKCRELDSSMVFTAGILDCQPGLGNVIPDRVECSFEIRSMNGAGMDHLVREMETYMRENSEIGWEFIKRMETDAVKCDPHIMEVIERASAFLAFPSMVLPSGAGHDAESIAHCIPMGMIFVPSREGISHCKEEWTSPEELARGAEVLYRTILMLDKEE